MIEGTEMNFRTCAFTGHRPQGMPFGFDEHDPKCAYLIDQIMAIMTNMIINDNVGRFLSGMAIGTDLIAAETTLRLKDVYSWIELECVIPCLNQSSKWAEKFRKRYDDVIRSCARTTLISTEFTKTCMYERNRYLVENCDILLAVWNGKPSGTGKTVDYAVRKGKSICVINPDDILK